MAAAGNSYVCVCMGRCTPGLGRTLFCSRVLANHGAQEAFGGVGQDESRFSK